MGDIIEFTTLPQHKRLFYKLLNNVMNFDVKTSGVAIVGLAGVLYERCDVTILIGVNNKTLIKGNYGEMVDANTPNIVNAEEYSKFWVWQHKGHVMFGRQGETESILKLPFNNALNYITFFCISQVQKVHWRIELPPLLKVPYKKPISKGQLRWEFMDKHLPEDALIGGYEDEPLYIVRVLLHRSLVLGKYVPSEEIAYFSWGGQILREKKFEVPNLIQVLCGYDCEWVSTQEDKIPTRAIQAGYSDGNREPIYIARVNYRGNIIPGRLQASQKLCYVLYKFQQITERRYEVLTSTHGPSSVNTFILPNEDTMQTVNNAQERRYNFWGQLDDEDN